MGGDEGATAVRHEGEARSRLVGGTVARGGLAFDEDPGSPGVREDLPGAGCEQVGKAGFAEERCDVALAGSCPSSRQRGREATGSSGVDDVLQRGWDPTEHNLRALGEIARAGFGCDGVQDRGGLARGTKNPQRGGGFEVDEHDLAVADPDGDQCRARVDRVLDLLTHAGCLGAVGEVNSPGAGIDRRERSGRVGIVGGEVQRGASGIDSDDLQIRQLLAGGVTRFGELVQRLPEPGDGGRGVGGAQPPFERRGVLCRRPESFARSAEPLCAPASAGQFRG